MSLLAALILAIKPSTRASALAWADRRYRACPEMSANLDPWYDAFSAYQQVEKKYGPSEEIIRRRATCCLRIGDLDQASQLVSKFSNPTDPLVGQIRERLRLRKLFQNLIPDNEQVLDFVHLDADRWAVLSAIHDHRADGEFFRKVFQPPFLRLMRTRSGSVAPFATAVKLAPNDAVPDESVFYDHLYLWKDKLGTPTLIVAYEMMYMNCDPGQFQFFRVGDSKPVHLATLDATYGVKAYPQGDRLAISVGMVYKVNWTDFYEWDGKRLRFANDRHPQGYGPLPWYRSPTDNGESRLLYTNWLRLAATQCIWKLWDKAARSLRQAERNCRLSLSEQARGVDRFAKGAHPDYGFYGETADNLKLIRQRLRWLAHHDYHHRLLYRPFDGDFQATH